MTVQKTADVVVLLENSSQEWSGPPDYLRLRGPMDYNISQTARYYQYAFMSQIEHREVNEPELEEKV
jgi:hypothetical protein